MKPPAFQFYADDFIGGVSDMTQQEVGAYILLLCHQWSRGSIPSDPSRAALIAKGEVTPHVMAKFPGGKNERLERVREERSAWLAKQADNGRKGMAKRWHNDRYNEPITSLLPNDNSPSPSPSPIKDAQTDRGCPTLTEVKAYAAMHAVRPEDAEQFWHHFESAGWVDKNGNQIKRWQSKLMTWKTNAAASVGGFDSKKRQPFVSELKAVLEAKRTLRDKIRNRGHENALGWTAANEEDRKQINQLNREIGELIDRVAKASV